MADRSGAAKCRRKFLRFFPKGFYDPKYVDWERGYKWEAHEAWQDQLGRAEFQSLLDGGKFDEVAARAVRLESRTNLLFSFEKMALRDAVKARGGAKAFAEGLFGYVYGKGSGKSRFEEWVAVIGELPRKQTRVLTWPLVTVFGFLGAPREHFFLKPMVTRAAAREYGFDFRYQSKPSWEVYENLLDFTRTASRDLANLRPRDMIDIQSFLWVQGSDEYEE